MAILVMRNLSFVAFSWLYVLSLLFYSSSFSYILVSRILNKSFFKISTAISASMQTEKKIKNLPYILLYILMSVHQCFHLDIWRISRWFFISFGVRWYRLDFQTHRKILKHVQNTVLRCLSIWDRILFPQPQLPSLTFLKSFVLN